MRIIKLLSVALSILALLAPPAFAHEAGTWVLRAGVGVVAPDSSNLVDVDGTTTTTVDVDDGTSLTLTGLYMFNPNWGFEILASYPFNHDIQATITDSGSTVVPKTKIAETDHLPPTFSLQYHFLPDGKFQPFVGAGLNYTTFFSTDVTEALIGLGITDIDLDDSFGLALQLGADWMLNDRWLLNFDLRWIDIESDLTVSDGSTSAEFGTVKIDPWVYAINLGYRF